MTRAVLAGRRTRFKEIKSETTRNLGTFESNAKKQVDSLAGQLRDENHQRADADRARKAVHPPARSCVHPTLPPHPRLAGRARGFRIGAPILEAARAYERRRSRAAACLRPGADHVGNPVKQGAPSSSRGRMSRLQRTAWQAAGDVNDKCGAPGFAEGALG